MSDHLKKSNTADRQSARGGRRLAKEQESETISRKSGARMESAAAVMERAEPQAEETVAWKSGETRKKQTPPDDNLLIKVYRTAYRKYRRIRRRLRHIIREERANHFPESERAVIQLLLFAWNMLPMLISHLHEAVSGRRRRSHQRGRTKAAGSYSRLRPVLFLGGASCLAAVAVFCSIYTIGTTVTYDGEEIANLSSESVAEEARSNLEMVTARTLGENFTIDDSLLQYSSGLMLRQDITDGETFEEALSEEIGLVTPAYCLYVEGEFIGATPYEGALEALLEQLKVAATTEYTVSCSFAEDIEIKQEYMPTEKIVNLGYLAETLYSTKTAEVTYEVKRGDTWSQIAANNGVTSKELLALNPGYDINKLQIGEVLTLSASVPYLTMTVQERERYVEDVQFDVVYTDDPSMYKGDEKVTSPGAYGAADVVANVTYVNGTEVEREIVSSVTLREPVTESRLRGTKERPTWHPTGTFRWPTTGRISSYFGGRKSPGGIGSTNHKGIDIAAPRGTPVYAADGGTVTYAGWMSGYGYTVRIDHGNGYVTYYAHNSSLTTSVGKHVYKGQQIAKVGSTGNSTGNHCHFEVRYNGVAKNPLNYLP